MSSLILKKHIVALFLGLLCKMGSAGSPDVGELSALSGKWIELRTEIASEERGAVERRTALESEIALLESEKEVLSASLAEWERSSTEEGKQRADQRARLEELQKSRGGLDASLNKAEAILSTFRKWIPESLLGDGAKRMENWTLSKNPQEGKSDTQRAQRVVSLLTWMESLQSEIHRVKETLEIAGTRRQVDVLYLGLARGYAVAGDDSWAAVGSPGEAGWTWEARPELAKEIRAACEMATRRRVAGFLQLPLKIADSEEVAK